MVIKVCAIVVVVSAILSAGFVIATEKKYPNWQINTATWAILWLAK
jgi:hypothetical protein